MTRSLVCESAKGHISSHKPWHLTPTWRIHIIRARCFCLPLYRPERTALNDSDLFSFYLTPVLPSRIHAEEVLCLAVLIEGECVLNSCELFLFYNAHPSPYDVSRFGLFSPFCILGFFRRIVAYKVSEGLLPLEGANFSRWKIMLALHHLCLLYIYLLFLDT